MNNIFGVINSEQDSKSFYNEDSETRTARDGQISLFLHEVTAKQPQTFKTRAF